MLLWLLSGKGSKIRNPPARALNRSRNMAHLKHAGDTSWSVGDLARGNTAAGSPPLHSAETKKDYI
jgi:hypothetical protein